MFRRILLALLFALPVSPRAEAADVEPTFRHEALKKLLDDLKDKDVAIRRQAALTLGMPDGSEGKGGPRPRGDLWPAMFGLVDAMQDKDMMVRGNAVKSLGLLMRYRGIPEKADPRSERIALAAIAALKDSEGLVRSAAAVALSSIGIESKDATASLQETMKHDDAVVRAAAADGAKGVRPITGIVPALAVAVGDRDAAVRLAAVNTLAMGRADSVGAIAPLIEALKDTDDKVGSGAAFALGNMGTGAAPAVFALVDVATDPKRKNRMAAIGAIGAIQSHPDIAVPTLIGALAIEETRPAAFQSLAYFGTNAKDAVPAVMAVSRDAKGSVVPMALYVLSIMDPSGPEFFQLLFAALQDSNPSVRGTALNYLGRGSSYPEALPALMVLFKVDGSLRERVAYAFGAMGREARPAVPMMMEVIGNVDTSQHLRQVLINSVNAVDPEILKPPIK